MGVVAHQHVPGHEPARPKVKKPKKDKDHVPEISGPVNLRPPAPPPLPPPPPVAAAPAAASKVAPKSAPLAKMLKAREKLKEGSFWEGD